jgi:hypothetical protein
MELPIKGGHIVLGCVDEQLKQWKNARTWQTWEH